MTLFHYVKVRMQNIAKFGFNNWHLKELKVSWTHNRVSSNCKNKVRAIGIQGCCKRTESSKLLDNSHNIYKPKFIKKNSSH